jgi:hypothetical protein
MNHFGEYKMDTKIKTSKEKWMELCRKYHRWCSWSKVGELTPEEAEYYIKTMSYWTGMEKI